MHLRMCLIKLFAEVENFPVLLIFVMLLVLEISLYYHCLITQVAILLSQALNLLL